MNKKTKIQSLIRVLILICLFSGLTSVYLKAQKPDTLKTSYFTGAFTLTTKGLSTFPNLTLGKPAAIFDFSAGGEKFRFEPTLRFALDGKPWTFIFWCRYEFFKSDKFQFKLGAHPAFAFKTITVTENGVTKDVMRAQRFLAGEISPVFFIGKNVSLGPYYIYAHGLEKDIVQHSNFVSFRVNFSSINLSDQYFLKWMAQGYFLKMDENDGFYINTNLSANRKNFPLSISSTINYKIESSIPGDDFLLNVNLTYAFGGKYRKI